MNENLRYQIEYCLQQIISEKNTIGNQFSRNKITIMAGKGGNHVCFTNNYKKAFLGENSPEYLNWNKLKSPNMIIKCKKKCQLRNKTKNILFFLLLCIGLVPLRKKNKHSLPNIFITDLPVQHINSTQLAEFFSEDRFKNIINPRTDVILVQSKQIKAFSRQKKIKFTTYIPLYMYRRNLSLRQKICVLSLTAIKLKQLLLNELEADSATCFRELVFDYEIWNKIKIDRKLKMICTQSNLRVMPTIMYKSTNNKLIENYMLWYSANSNLFYKRNEEKVEVERNYLTIPYIDYHLVWNKQEKIDVEKYAKGEVKNFGSIVFYSSSSSRVIKNNNSGIIRVTYFDITPPKSGNNDHFISSERATQTYNDIKESLNFLACHLNLNIQLLVKAKRKKSMRQANSYTKMLKRDSRNRQIKLIDPKTNLYSLIAMSDLVIGYPWTSPVQIAKEMDIPSIYYVSDLNKEWELARSKSGCPLYVSKDDLKEVMFDRFKELLKQ